MPWKWRARHTISLIPCYHVALFVFWNLSMRPMTSWAQYYVDWLTRLGIIRFSLLLAFFIILLAVGIQVGITLLLRGAVDTVDIVRSVFFGLLVTPWAAYFLTAVVDELEDSRQRLTQMVSKLQEMRERDQAMNI